MWSSLCARLAASRGMLRWRLRASRSAWSSSSAVSVPERSVSRNARTWRAGVAGVAGVAVRWPRRRRRRRGRAAGGAVCAVGGGGEDSSCVGEEGRRSPSAVGACGRWAPTRTNGRAGRTPRLSRSDGLGAAALSQLASASRRRRKDTTSSLEERWRHRRRRIVVARAWRARRRAARCRARARTFLICSGRSFSSVCLSTAPSSSTSSELSSSGGAPEKRPGDETTHSVSPAVH